MDFFIHICLFSKCNCIPLVTHPEELSIAHLDDLQQKYSKKIALYFLLKIPYTTALIDELRAAKKYPRRNTMYVLNVSPLVPSI